MSFGRRLLAALLCVAATGCITVGDSDDSDRTTFNLGWLIGGIGMAVDGDDRDDHIHWFEDDDDCKCRGD